jgi:two-component system, OmpR family, osmolarity sensor histidine kinase EnvZ
VGGGLRVRAAGTARMTRQPRTVFVQLALVIALVLAGAAAMALLLGRELAARPATTQLLRTIDGMADALEALERDGHDGERVLQSLRDGGLDVRRDAPPASAVGFAPLLRGLQRRATASLGDSREVRLGKGEHGGVLWVRLDTRTPLWVAFAYDDALTGSRRFSMLLLAGCGLLVWLAAAYFARRLTQPLRRLAHAAPALVGGEEVAIDARGAPRELRELQAALLRAGEDVREVAAERNLMLAGISHDLRTPLTRLQYALALVPDTDPALRDGMERDIAEIDAILSQFIAYARDGRDEPSEQLDLAATCRNVVAAVGGEWTLDVPDTAPLRGRPIALQRAIENLAGNARRHGAAPFALSLSRDGDGWAIEIRDHGPGLEAAMAATAMRPFVRGGEGGSGLGLAIVERVARQHRGRLELSPNMPAGLRARLTLRDT